jgi:hypothetical protein
MPGVARVAGLDLLDVEAIKLPAQFLGAYRSTRLSPLVGFVAEFTQRLHMRIERQRCGCYRLRCNLSLQF